MQIIDLTPENEALIDQVAQILVDELPLGWSTLDDARAEIRESFARDRLSRVAVDEQGGALGWVGAIETYSHAWELHPLAVRRDRQMRGIGAALVRDLEELLRGRGCLTIYLGTDDETDQTSAANIDLFPNVLDHAAELRVVGRHPVSFYRALGYAVIGLVPDANGPGRPDILMAKRIAPVTLPR